MGLSRLIFFFLDVFWRENCLCGVEGAVMVVVVKMEVDGFGVTRNWNRMVFLGNCVSALW